MGRFHIKWQIWSTKLLLCVLMKCHFQFKTWLAARNTMAFTTTVATLAHQTEIAYFVGMRRRKNASKHTTNTHVNCIRRSWLCSISCHCHAAFSFLRIRSNIINVLFIYNIVISWKILLNRSCFLLLFYTTHRNDWTDICPIGGEQVIETIRVPGNVPSANGPSPHQTMSIDVCTYRANGRKTDHVEFASDASFVRPLLILSFSGQIRKNSRFCWFNNHCGSDNKTWSNTFILSW